MLLTVAWLAIDCAGAGAPEPFVLRAGHALAFEVTTPGAEAPSLYLLGSFHILDAPISLGPKLERAYRNAAALVLEVDLRAYTKVDLGQAMMRHGALGTGEQLSDFVSEETIAALDARLLRRQLSDQQIQHIHRLRPWAIALFLAVSEGEKQGLHADYGVEQYFVEHAPRDARIFGLETPEEQFSALSFMSKAAQEEMLIEALSTEASSELLALIDAWKRGDEEALAKLVLEGTAEEVYQVLFVARNERMAEALLALMQQGAESDTWFAVIGAGHLVGESSVATMLRGSGLDVRRMAPSD